MTEPSGMQQRLSDEAGTTLVEVLMAVVLVGIAFVALLAGMATVSLGSDIHRKQSDAEVVLTSAAERLKDPAVEHVPCAAVGNANLAPYVTAARTASRPAGWAASTITITAVRYWDGSGFGTTCHDTTALGNLLRLQEITVEVTSPDGRATESITVVRGPAKVDG